ncbi:alpha-ketoglutarate decarboxylase [Winogradskyella maritima]|uniref:Alpha-ketoglutarate decarboxylase n=1 Tax=Winogradskyella maritima TaxID=1517766 RepID=A0ABV8AEI1_9FLAO|nr:alpha-ketoglutarate decarboxylase [Winogradskyella maritima]
MKIHLRKIGFVLTLFICFSNVVNSQNNNAEANNFWNNVQFGGGIGLNFGDGFFSGTLAPSAIYRFNPTVATGLGLNASYSSQKNVFNSTVFGASIITLVNPINEIQLSAEFENLFINRNFEDGFFDPNNNDDSYYYPALFMGIGYSTNNVTFGIRYDILYDENRSIYNSAFLPFVRVFF